MIHQTVLMGSDFVIECQRWESEEQQKISYNASTGNPYAPTAEPLPKRPILQNGLLPATSLSHLMGSTGSQHRLLAFTRHNSKG